MGETDEQKELNEIRKRKLEELSVYASHSIAPEKNEGDNMMTEDWPDTPLKVTDADFDDTVKRYPVVVVDCWAPWCGPCKMLGPIIDELASEYKGKIVFGKLNTDENREIPQKFGVMGIPNLLFFVNGEFIDQAVGVVPKAKLEEALNSLLS